MKFKRFPCMTVIASFALALAQFATAANSGSRIAFIGGPEGRDVYTMNPDGSEIKQLTSLGPNNSAFYESWSPDGRELIFNEFPPTVPAQLWVMNADGSNQHLFFADSTYAGYTPSFSPDGRYVVFSRCPQSPHGDGCAIYRVRADGTGLTALTQSQPEVNDFFPVYSPDGMTIAFNSFSRGGVLSAIYLMDPDGSDIHLLTPPFLSAWSPGWSPDGERLAVSSHCCNPQNNDIWTINRHSGEPSRLTGSSKSDLDIPVAYYNQGSSWSPRGDAIVYGQYTVATNSAGIFVMNADGSGMSQIMKLSPSPPRRADSRNDGKLRGANRPHNPREIEKGGAWPRWSPDLQ
jgi:Tol biopolymer transport system component